MSILIILLLILSVVDLRKLKFKEDKKEIFIYISMLCVIVLIRLYHNNPNNPSIIQMFFDITG